MIISELNHLESVSEGNGVVGGITNQVQLDIRTFVEYVDINKYVSAGAYVKGNVAFAEADAVSLGYNSVSNALTQTYTDNYSSISTATSAGATDDGYYYYY